MNVVEGSLWTAIPRRLSPSCPNPNHVHVPVHVPVEMPIFSSRGHIGASDALLQPSSANSGPSKTRKESNQLLSGSSVRRYSTALIRKADAPPESLGRNEKSIWEYYNEMAAVEDNIRENEWRDLADTILGFVCLGTLRYIVDDIPPGWSICCLPFRLHCLHNSPTPTQ